MARWFTDYLGWDTLARPTVVEWLTFPQHRLRAVTTGAVFQDDLGDLTAARTTLNWYPEELWYYLLTAQWQRIAEEEAFMARCGDVGDELGSTIVAARLVSHIMHLCFLMERRHAPYAKWLGSAFSQLTCGQMLEPHLLSAVRAATWQERQQALATSYELVANVHNELAFTDRLEPGVRRYFGREYLVIGADRFASAIEARISDDEIRRLPRRLGSLNQLIPFTDVLEPPDNRQRFGRIFD